jgi:hypothetical protein
LKLRAAILLTLALLAFSTPMLVTLNVSAPKLHGASCGIVENVNPPMQPCGDPIDNPDFPHQLVKGFCI